METPLFAYTLRLADNALVLGHRLGEWCGHGPMLEEDLALANMALDCIGQARNFYAYAGEIEGRGRSEDDLAYLRDCDEFRNILLVERPRGDFAFTILRQFLYAAFMHPAFERLSASKDERLAAIAAKAVKEMAYHLRHSAEWVIRLGDGTEESAARLQEALADLWPFTGEMFEVDETERALIEAGVAVDPAGIRPLWLDTVDRVFADALLNRPKDGWMQTGGRRGEHSEHLGHLLADLQFMQRAYPGSTW
ncbi:MAG: phenylacetate-CoA oxygenase subunit PaaC [Methylobacterium sp.]|nr:phenylacetate-CoA oxygenase subunit PaaC [Methylobacterium sp.]MCA3609364.1 phenylacetate-CoA oxygenase subunit PaaC [Methylobacterium sp.]MCA3619091.1 phenylacetate-CoA oxygenase subunit PaaC [Methylobacterium sp.]MCA3621809.1 phenylacetate-CoA oxygenase subunit PaaC [Methylobacterium sp.]